MAVRTANSSPWDAAPSPNMGRRKAIGIMVGASGLAMIYSSMRIIDREAKTSQILARDPSYITLQNREVSLTNKLSADQTQINAELATVKRSERDIESKVGNETPEQRRWDLPAFILGAIGGALGLGASAAFVRSPRREQ